MSEEDLENGIETNIIVLLDFYKPIKLIENTRSEVSSFDFAIDDFENIPEDVKAKAVFAHPRTIKISSLVTSLRSSEVWVLSIASRSEEVCGEEAAKEDLVDVLEVEETTPRVQDPGQKNPQRRLLQRKRI